MLRRARPLDSSADVPAFAFTADWAPSDTMTCQTTRNYRPPRYLHGGGPPVIETVQLVETVCGVIAQSCTVVGQRRW